MVKKPKYPDRFPADQPIGNRSWPMINGQYQTDSEGSGLPDRPGLAPAPASLGEPYSCRKPETCCIL